MQELFNDYLKDGFSISKVSGLEDWALTASSMILEDQVSRESLVSGNLDLTNLIERIRKSPDGYFGYLKAVARSPHFMGLPNHPSILKSLEHIGIAVPTLATPPILHVVHKDLMLSKGKVLTPPHQDAISTRGPIGQAVVWVPLHECSEKSSGYEIQAWPGSHRRGIIRAENSEFGHTVAVSEMPSERPKSLGMRLGEALFFSQYLIHRTSSRGVARLAVSFRVNDLSDPEWEARSFYNPFNLVEEDREFPDGRHLAPKNSLPLFDPSFGSQNSS